MTDSGSTCDCLTKPDELRCKRAQADGQLHTLQQISALANFVNSLYWAEAYIRDARQVSDRLPFRPGEKVLEHEHEQVEGLLADCIGEIPWRLDDLIGKMSND